MAAEAWASSSSFWWFYYCLVNSEILHGSLRRAVFFLEARAAKAGLWASAFIAPWDWRNRNKKTVILGANSLPASTQEKAVSYTHLRAHETVLDLVCRL